MLLGFLAFLGVVIWWLIGMAGFLWRWTKTWDLTDHHLDILFMSGILGPFGWLPGPWLRDDDMDKRNIDFIRKHVSTYAKLNEQAMKAGIKPLVMWTDYEYLSNPHRNRVIIRTRNKITRQLQEGKVL